MKDLWFNKVGNSPRVRSERVTIQQPTAQINTAYATPSAVAVNDNRTAVTPVMTSLDENIRVAPVRVNPSQGIPDYPVPTKGGIPTFNNDSYKENIKKTTDAFIKCFDEYKIPECVKDYYLSQQKWRSERPDISSLLHGPYTQQINAQVQKIMGEHQDKQPKASKCAQDFLTAQEKQREKNRKVLRTQMQKNRPQLEKEYANVHPKNEYSNMDGRGLRRDSSGEIISIIPTQIPEEEGGIYRNRLKENVPIEIKSPPRKLKTCDEIWAETLKMQGGKMIPATESECLELCIENAGGRNAIKKGEAIIKQIEDNFDILVASEGKEQADIKLANAKAMICFLKRTIKARCGVHKKTFFDKYKFWILGGIGAYLLLKK